MLVCMHSPDTDDDGKIVDRGTVGRAVADELAVGLAVGDLVR